MDTNRFRQLLESHMGNVKPLLMEQPTVDKKLNLFCQGGADQQRLENLTYDSEMDMYGGLSDEKGFKKLYLNMEASPVAQEYEPQGDQIFVRVLNATNPDLARFRKTIGVDNAQGKLVILYTPSESNPYFCTLDSGTDQDWTNYFNSL
jgi:hypothetical protein